MKRYNKILIYIVAPLLLCFCIVAFLFAGKWLKDGDEPIKADAVIVLAGSFARSIYAADLYRQGYTPAVYISKPVREHDLKLLDDMNIFIPRMEDVCREILLRKGVPEDRIHFLDKPALSTIDEAESVRRAFHGGKCIVLIVTSPYHVKRTQMIFKKTATACKVRVLSTPYEPFADKWWTDRDSARSVLLELSKIVFYKLGGQFSYARPQ